MLSDRICAAFHSGIETWSQTAGVEIVASSKAPLAAEGSWARAAVFRTDAPTFLATPALAEEVFGPTSLIVECNSLDAMAQVAHAIGGHLASAVHSTPADRKNGQRLLKVLERYSGRIVFDAFPTGVEVCAAMHHGGPYPATTHSYFNSIGTTAFLRFVRPICYQDCPSDALPHSLRS
jgi:NADP-dependent aldehyde dehydrogenase